MPESRLRPRRSALYVPGSNARAIEKARSLDADVLIFDLEDAVAPDKKDEARRNVAEALAKGGYRAERVIRVNHLSTREGVADLKMAAKSGCDAVLLPKVEGAKDVRDASLRLGASGAAEMTLWCMIETPVAVLRVEEVAFASPHLACLVMGTSDLTKDLRARHTHDRLPVITSLSLCLLAARAAGLVTPRSASACSPRARPGSSSSTACISTSTTKRASSRPAGRAPRWASTAARSSTPRRSPAPTRPTARRPTTSRGRSASSTRTPRRSPKARAWSWSTAS